MSGVDLATVLFDVEPTPQTPANDLDPWQPHREPSSAELVAAGKLDPQALQTINAPGAWSLGVNGAGVTVATIADGVDPTNPDLQRNPAYGQAGTPVVQQVDFSGDPAGTPTAGGQAR